MIYEIAGWVGSAIVLTAYLLVSLHKIKPRSVAYQALNAIGSIGIIINVFVHRAIPSVVLNVAWLGISLFVLVTLEKKHKKKR